ncbi:efflux RND transporter periplasmic adaptor subunit [Pararobbsia silviterrae]|uniref:Efflux RND transporter periplasmic adaptor subunit n=1 Tax=Pararobbsia silviterrae TaxID=1792498 RepID=A0A494XBU5_9BURK|nr:efflux RND transporter periplasmic adaptor subunit [Pararobbsia silviterrae]RKP47101.1 efflux RND transporter periplasmic adaptor subunit [Pararobbsia silviterrae]
MTNRRIQVSRAITILLPLAVVLALLWWTLLRTVQTIDTVPIEYGDIESSVTALGTLQPLSYVDVGAQASGAIRRIAVAPGSHVKKGDLLVEIDPSIQQAKVDTDRAALDSLHAQLAQAHAQRDLAQQEADRQRQMNTDGATRIEDVQSADSALRVAVARLADLGAQIDGARSTLNGDLAQLGYTRIFAPMGGTVVTLDAREGQTLNATYQTPNILRIADLSKMTVWTDVSEADIGKVRAGMPVYFTTLGYVTNDVPRRWTAHVRQILPAPPHTPSQSQSGESGTQTAAPSQGAGKVVLYTVLFDVDNADGALMPQMSAQVFFVRASATHVLVVPLTAMEAVAGEPDRYTAKVLVGERVETREVRTGTHDRLHAEVVSGLSRGDRLVTDIRTERAGEGKFRW